MRLIDDYVTDFEDIKVGLEESRPEPFGRKVQELEVPIGCIVQSEVHLVTRHPGMDGRSLDSLVPEVLDLVLHQGDERSDHKGQPVRHECGHLEADRLPSSGREYSQYIPALERRLDDLFLHRPEGIMAPVLSQYFQR